MDTEERILLTILVAFTMALVFAAVGLVVSAAIQSPSTTLIVVAVGVPVLAISWWIAGKARI